MRRDERVVDIFPVAHACCQPSKVEPFGVCTAPVETFVRLFGLQFFTRHCRISLDAFFDVLAVPSGDDYTLSAPSRTVAGVTELPEPFDGPPDI